MTTVATTPVLVAAHHVLAALSDDEPDWSGRNAFRRMADQVAAAQRGDGGWGRDWASTPF